MAEAPTASQDRCFLLELPSELRLQIYGHISEVTEHVVWHRVLGNRDGEHRIRRNFHIPPHPMLQICRTVTIECRPLLTPAPLCCIVLKSDDHVAVSRSEDAQREPVFSQYSLLNQSAHIASAREITVLIESVAVGSTASSENARLLDAVSATFRAIARNSKVEILIVKIKEGKPAFCSTACEIIAARRYPGKIQIDVEARGLSRGMLKMLEDFQREHEISMID